MKKRLVFIGCDRLGGRGLEKLAASSPLKEYYELVGVVTSGYNGENDRLVEIMARMLGLPVYTGKINSPEGLAFLDSLSPDAAAMMEFDQKVSPEVIRRFELFINMHPADLPRYRGGAPMQYQILDGIPLVVTVHRVSPEFDAGDYIAKSAPLDITGLTMDNVNQLAAREGAKLLEKVLLDWAKGCLQSNPQKGTPSLALEKELPARLEIHWNQDSGEAIRAKVLAGNKWFRPALEGAPVMEAWFIPSPVSGLPPGKKVSEYDNFVKYTTIDGFVILRIDRAGVVEN